MSGKASGRVTAYAETGSRENTPEMSGLAARWSKSQRIVKARARMETNRN